MKKLFKKSLAVIMVVIMALTAAPLNGFVGLDLPSLLDFKAEAATEYTSGYYTYTVSDGEATITHCDKAISGDVTIPSTLGGYTVTKIGAYAFENCFNMTNVTMPNKVTVIDVGAFSSCENLQEVTMPSNLTVIGDMAFKFCLILKNITIPESVTTIGNTAFSQCTSLTEITIPDNVTTLGWTMFHGCYELTSISIGKGVKSIAGILFGYCPGSKLISINVDENNQYFSSDNYGVLFNKDKTTLIQYPLGNTRERYIIPDSVTTISYKAFEYSQYIKFVTIPDSVSVIGRYAFADSQSLESVIIPDSVSAVGWDAFFRCSNLTSATISGNKDTIYETEIFAGSGLKKVTICDGVTTIGDLMFDGCEKLESVSISNSVTTIGPCAFGACLSLEYMIIPDSVESIGEQAFAACLELEYLHIPANVTEIGKDNNLYWTTTYICSDTSDCYAKTYADENSIEFRVCTGHDGHTPTDPDEPVTPDNPSDEWEESTPEINKPTTNKINFGDTLVLTLGEIVIPEGYAVKWFVEGTGVSTTVSEDGLECRVTSIANGNATIYAKLVDADENVVTNADGEEIFDEITITSKAGFWQKLISFFKNLFGIIREIY